MKYGVIGGMAVMCFHGLHTCNCFLPVRHVCNYLNE